jgi:hypothetical protein
MQRVWENSRQKGSSLLLLLAIADNAHDNGVSSISLGILSKKTRLSERQVARIIHDLEKEGELRVFRDRGKNSKYFVTVWQNGEPDVPHCNVCNIVQSKQLNTHLHKHETGQILCNDCVEDIEQLLTHDKMSDVTGVTPDKMSGVQEGDDLFKLTVNSKQLTVNSNPVNSKLNYVGDKSPKKIQSIEEFLTKVPHKTRELARAWCYRHGRAPTEKESAYWRKAWNQQEEIGIRPEFIVLAYNRMLQDGLTIKSPQSVTAVAESIQMREHSLDLRGTAASNIPVERSSGDGRKLRT